MHESNSGTRAANPRIGELLDYIDAQREHLRTVANAIPPAKVNQAPPNGGWTVLGVLEHLSIVEPRIASLIRKKTAEAREAGAPAETDSSPILPKLDVARFLDRSRALEAPGALQPKTNAELSAVWQALDASRADLRDAIIAADGLALGTLTAPHLYFGPLDLYTWIAFAGAHEARHADQIREIGFSLGGAA